MGILFLGEAHAHHQSNKESTSGDHFLYRTFQKMAAEYTPISQEGSNFHKKTAKKFVLPPKFQILRFELHKKFTNVYGSYDCAKAGHAVWAPNG